MTSIWDFLLIAPEMPLVRTKRLRSVDLPLRKPCCPSALYFEFGVYFGIKFAQILN